MCQYYSNLPFPLLVRISAQVVFCFKSSLYLFNIFSIYYIEMQAYIDRDVNSMIFL
jgi:hypothetical protein